eukprot:270750_1
MSADDLQLPYISHNQYQNCPSWLLQYPQPSHALNNTPSATTDSETPQQMNIDAVDQSVSNTNTSISPSQFLPNLRNTNDYPSSQHSNTNDRSSPPNTHPTNYIMIDNVSSAQLNTVVPSYQDFECLFSMLYELNDRLTQMNAEVITDGMLTSYRLMISDFAHSWHTPNHARVIPLLLALNDLFGNQEIDPFTTKRLFHKIFDKYHTFKNRG